MLHNGFGGHAEQSEVFHTGPWFLEGRALFATVTSRLETAGVKFP